MQITALAVFNIFATMVLRKGMRLHPAARAKYQRGTLVSLGLSECNRLVESAMTLAQGAAIPPMILGALIFGSALVGPVFIVSILGVTATVMAMLKIGNVLGRAFGRKAIEQGLRLSIVNEMLQSMRLTKFYALEDHFQSQIQARRTPEEGALLRMRVALAFNWSASLMMPLITTVLVLLLHQLAYGELPDVPNTFAVLAVIKVLSVPFAFFGNFLATLSMLLASAGRLRDLLLQPEVTRREALLGPTDSQEEKVDPCLDSAISIQGSSFSWKGGEDIVLPKLYLEVPKGKLIALVGELGSGKSSVLAATLGEMEEVAGACPTKIRTEQVAYCSQEPMIMNASVRENVLFGLDCDEKRYQEALESSMLGPDLAILPAGDDTEIGEKGLTLSGGQKARVALARAVYAALGVGQRMNALVLLDDPLSAVDVHVGSHMWDRCICGALKGATRVLVTNQIHFLSHSEVSEIYVLERGVIVERGTHQQLLAMEGGRFAQMQRSLEGHAGQQKRNLVANARLEVEVGEVKLMEKVPATAIATAKEVVVDLKQGGRVTSDERKEEGAMTLQTLNYYLMCLGGSSWPFVFFLFFLSWTYNIGEFLPEIYLAMWREGYSIGNESGALTRIAVWWCIGLLGIGLAFNCRMVWAFATVRAARLVHTRVLVRVLGCPMSFFDATPSGRVMNRLGEDQMNVDWTVALQVEVCALVHMMVLNTMVLVFGVCPYMMSGLVVVVPAVAMLREVHRRTTRESVRFWMLTKSPMFNVVEETLAGIPTVAAFGRSTFFLRRFENALAVNNNWCFTKDVTNQWAEQRLQLVGALTTGCLAAFLWALPDLVPPSVAALSLIYCMQLSQYLRWAAFFLVQVESSLASVERSVEFTKLAQEAPRQLPGDELRLAESWPGELPTVVFDNLQVRYRPHLPLVIRGLSAQLRPKEKVGVVGRTGSGKSTLLSSLFRLVEPAGGRILIGGVDIAEVGLGLLRRRITIVPQDPLLFSGALRRNLDPTEERSDAEILEGLTRCGMQQIFSRLEGGLEAHVAEQGGNFSLGERQLLCLARALLRGAKVLCLDEATANVDPENDARIQQTIRTGFASCTVLTIAHRLHTVMDSDRIMVLDSGELAEFDAPAALLARPGKFQSMAEQAGIGLGHVQS
ncbi:unnamed protein product [Polarella glacialis]|uniref:Uncharacterized protein n=1 Tax=Polarella glacialis TaxID=89957 RepID=A0A813J4D3_POLGL|nr:unnamed protein product [Polarella glacialis]